MVTQTNELSAGRRRLRLAGVSLATLAMLLAEIVLSAHANFVYSDNFSALMPLFVFGPLAVGTILGAFRRLATISRGAILLATALAIVAALAGIAHGATIAALALALPFIGFGAYLTRVVATERLAVLVLGLGLGGALLYATINGLATSLGGYLPIILVAACALGAILDHPSRWIAVGGALVVALSFASARAGIWDGLSRQERINFPHYHRVRPPIFTPLIRTDVISDGDQTVLLTNGSRSALLETPERVRTAFARGRMPRLTHEGPYVASAHPKSVLVIGSAEGDNVLAALVHGADRVVAVDINPAVFDLLAGPLATETGGVYTDPRVETIVSEGRRYLETTDRVFDLITIQGVQTGTQNEIYHPAFVEAYLYTTDAMRVTWRHLSDDGALYIEERRRSTEEGNGSTTMIGGLAGQARDALGLQDPVRQCLRFSYARGERPREGLVIFKQPLTDAMRLEANARLVDMGAEVEGGCDARALSITDDRPFFVSAILAPFARMPKPALWLGLAVVSLALVMFATRAPKRAAPLALFTSGVGYILFLLGVSGPATVLLGEPALTTPVIFTAVYVWGLFGGLLALQAKRSLVLRSVIALVVYVVVLVLLLPVLKGALLPLSSLAVRGVIVVAAVMPAAFLAELPYIHLLGRFEGDARGRAFVWENLGTLAGLVIGVPIELASGFSGALFFAAALYAVTFLVLRRAP